MWSGGGAQAFTSHGDEACASGVGLETEMSDADEAARQDMLQESLNEVRRGEGELLADIPASPIAVAKGYLSVAKRDDAIVADGDAMGVTTQIAQHLSRSGHGSLAVDDPLLGSGLSQQTPAHVSTHSSRALLQGELETFEQLAAKDPREDTYRDQEARPRSDPGVAGEVQTAAGHDAMDVGVEAQRLSPGVEHGDRPGGRSQPALAHGLERAHGGFKEQRVARAPLGEEERVKRGRYGKDQVEVGHGE